MKVHLFLKRYLAALNQYKWAGLASFACISAIAGAIAPRLPETTHLAQAKLLYKPAVEATPATGTQPAAQKLIPGPESLMSDQLLQQTSDALEAKDQSIAPNELRNRIKLEKDPKQENQILIRSQDSNAEKAKLIVESFVNTVSNQNLASKRREVEASLKLLGQRRGLLEKNLRVAEEELREFGRQEKPAIQAAIDGSLVSAITTIQQQQRQLRQQLQGTDAEIASLQNQLGMTPQQAYVASALSADATIANLTTKIADIKSQVEVQRRELQPKHPDIIALQQQQQVNEVQLQQRVADIAGENNGISSIQTVALRRVSSLDKARQDLANKLVNLQTQRDRLAQELGILSRSEPELRRNYQDGTELKLEQEKLTKEVVRYRETFDQTEKQLAAAELKKAETRSDWVSEGTPQAKEISNWWLNRPVILLAGGVLAVLIAGTTVLLLDVLRGRLLIPEEVQAILKQRVPFLGVLPHIPKQAGQKTPVLIRTDSPYLNAYELLRSSLNRHGQSQPLKMVVLSSTRKSEGKTIAAYNLAIASARAGKKTLLIEADLRASSQVQALGVATHESAESGSLIESMQIESVQPAPHIKNLFVLPSSSCVEQVTEALESSQMQELLKLARDKFEFVVIDATALRFSDALLIEPHTDGLILVTRPGYTDRSSFKIVIEKLTEFSDIKLLGVVMNNVTTSHKHAHLLSL
ncbi:MAG: AAA family ATPase [Myxacorys californica WJT36-NPBG1]|nr:AAA family ATPase [Myxacorys californica WJT36-NPBG1]